MWSITLGGAGKEINMAYHNTHLIKIKWCVVTDVIKPVTDTDMAILGCLSHLSGCKPGRTTPALILLTVQAGLNLVVWSEQQVGLLYWSRCGDQVQGSRWVPPYSCCPMICIIPFHFCWLSFSLPLCLPSVSSLLQNKQPTPSCFIFPHWSQLLYIHTQIWCFWYWYSVILALFGITDTVTWALLALQYSPTGLQYFLQLTVKFGHLWLNSLLTMCEIWLFLTMLPATLVSFSLCCHAW